MSLKIGEISAGGSTKEEERDRNGQQKEEAADDDNDEVIVDDDVEEEADNDKGEKERPRFKVHLPTAMALSAEGELHFRVDLAAGGILFMEEGRVEEVQVLKEVKDKAKRAYEEMNKVIL